ncbi:MAG: hypothetical protein IJI97_10530 [Clostridia bacterium]|nr:hypothetical protein [Clostridia bacterium]
MKISRRDWQRFTRRLAQVNEQAAAQMAAWMAANPAATDAQIEAAAYAICVPYGEASAELACLMYDAIVTAEGLILPPAEPARPATYAETVKAVRGTMKNLENTVPATVGRLVKQCGADTMLQNAKRDGAEFAWIPVGDTCPFCLLLASNGWQYAGSRNMKGGHAEHIHANCDCTYAVRHSSKTQVAGYDPEAYYDRLVDADPGGSWKDRVNALRREEYQANRDEINQQKRIAYRARKEREAAGKEAGET